MVPNLRPWLVPASVTREERDAIRERQKGLCALCFQPLADGPYRENIDHCHYTDKVRGLLHENCNIRLGCVEQWIWRGGIRGKGNRLLWHLERRTPWVADSLRYLGFCP